MPVLFFPSERIAMDYEGKSTLDVVADIAEFANAVASLLVGHRGILVNGGFDPNMADHMCFGLHAKLLGLVHEWEPEEDLDYFIGDDEAYGIDEDDE